MPEKIGLRKETRSVRQIKASQETRIAPHRVPAHRTPSAAWTASSAGLVLPKMHGPQQGMMLRELARGKGNRQGRLAAMQGWSEPARGSLVRTNRHPLRRDDDDSDITPEYFGLEDVRDIRARMQVRFFRAQQFAMEGVGTADAVRNALLRLSGQYGRAWDRYERVIGAGRAEARNQQDWLNIGVGIGVGILLGIGAAFLLPSAAAGALTITAGEAAVATASAAGQAAGGAFITSQAGEAFAIAGTDLEPSGMEPAVLEMAIWRHAAGLYRNAVRFVHTATDLHLLTNAAEYLSGQIRLRVAGGDVDMSDDNMFDLLETLSHADAVMTAFDQRVQTALTQLEDVRQRLGQGLPQEYGLREMEQDIWVLWIAQLSFDGSDVLDLDAIEDYLHGDIGILGSNSVLDVDFGRWTSTADEHAAIRAARRRASAIRTRLQQLQGGE